MTISQAITALQKQRELYGDVEVCSDCPKCLHSYPVGYVVPVQVRVTLLSEKQEKEK